MPTTSTTEILDASFSNVNGSTTDGSMPPVGRNTRYITLNSTRTHDGPVPNRRLIMAWGGNATTNLSGTKQDVLLQRGYYRLRIRNRATNPATYSWYESRGDVANCALPAYDPTAVTSADNQAKANFIKKARAAQTSVMGGVFLGELREALHMVRHPAQALRKGFDDYYWDLKKGRKGSKKQRLRRLQDTYLEHVFGWKPLIGDIQAAAQALARFQNRPHFQMIVGNGIVERPGVYTPNQLKTVGPLQWYVHQRLSHRAVVKYYGTVDLQTTTGHSLRRDLGFTLDNFVPTLWELIPYSFVVDYFTNIGDIISAACFNYSNVKWTARTEVIESIWETRSTAPLKPTLSSSHDLLELTGKPGSSLGVNRRVTRVKQIGAGGLVPSLELNLPDFASQKWLNLAALVKGGRSLSPY